MNKEFLKDFKPDNFDLMQLIADVEESDYREDFFDLLTKEGQARLERLTVSGPGNPRPFINQDIKLMAYLFFNREIIPEILNFKGGGDIFYAQYDQCCDCVVCHD